MLLLTSFTAIQPYIQVDTGRSTLVVVVVVLYSPNTNRYITDTCKTNNSIKHIWQVAREQLDGHTSFLITMRIFHGTVFNRSCSSIIDVRARNVKYPGSHVRLYLLHFSDERLCVDHRNVVIFSSENDSRVKSVLFNTCLSLTIVVAPGCVV